LEALKNAGRKLMVIGHELMEPTRVALMDGVLTIVIAHPTTRIQQAAVDAMCDAASGQHMIGFEIYTAENI
jgi:LacI family transcriptional regulator